MGIAHSNAIRRLVRGPGSWFYVAQCAGCNRRGNWVCSICMDLVPELVPTGCPRCYAETPETCECADYPAEIATVAAVYPFYGWARDAILRFKFDGESVRAVHLAESMSQLLPPPDQVDLLIPVPLHRDRHRTRGYNQAELLARELSVMTGIALGDGLVRRLERGHQVGLSKSQRWAAVQDAFACPDPAVVAGKQIVIVDDVITTGATVSNCAIALRKAGAASVSAIAFARG